MRITPKEIEDLKTKIEQLIRKASDSPNHAEQAVTNQLAAAHKAAGRAAEMIENHKRQQLEKQ